MMIGMIIADDEFNIRQGLMTIPWSDLGIEIKGVASNGEEALSMVKEQQPEILLTDIRMPKLDGLKLIEAVAKQHPGIKTILLTGYQDFNYALTAIKLGAYGYVLKPSDPDEIVEIVQKAKKQILHENEIRIENEHIRKEFDNNKPLILNSFLHSLLYGRCKDLESVRKKCAALQLALDHYVVMVLEYETHEETPSNHVSMLKEEALSIASGYHKCYSVDVNHSNLCIIHEIPKEKKSTKQEMLYLASEIRSAIKTNFNEYVSIGISKRFDCPEDMSGAFNQALNCLKMKFSLGKGAIIHIEDLADSIKRQDDLPLNPEDEILENIKTGNYRKVEKLAREFLFRLSKEQNECEQVIKSICFNVLSRSIRMMDNQLNCKDYPTPSLNALFTVCKDIGDLEEYFITTLMNIMDSIHTKNCTAKNKAITDILDYIDKSYMNDISLLTLSEHIHMNHIYISRLIKRETGETFLDILTKTRMKKACELLRNLDLKTYEISLLVGIRDSGYFSQVFKKTNGTTPSEYRDQLMSRLKSKNEAAQ